MSLRQQALLHAAAWLVFFGGWLCAMPLVVDGPVAWLLVFCGWLAWFGGVQLLVHVTGRGAT